MSEPNTPRSRSLRQDHLQHADAILDELFEDLDSGLRTSPMLPRQARFAYADARPPLPTPGLPWGRILVGVGLISVAMASWGLWHSYQSLITQVTEVDPLSPSATTPLPPALDLTPSRETDMAMDTIPDITETTADIDVPAKPPVQTPTQKAVTPPKKATLPNKPLVAMTKPTPLIKTGSRSTLGLVSASHRSTLPVRSEIFSYEAPSRRPLVAPQPQAPRGSSMQLVGTVSGPGTPMALILVDNIVREVPVGQAVMGGWRVQKVNRDGVTIANGSRGSSMHLGLGQTL